MSTASTLKKSLSHTLSPSLFQKRVSNTNRNKVNVALVGEKRSEIEAFLKARFNLLGDMKVPHETYHEMDVHHSGKDFLLNVCWVNNVNEKNERFLKEANVVMVLFATDDIESIEKWKSIIAEKNDQVPIILVARPDCQEQSGLKLDVTSGYQMASDLGAAAFYMCNLSGDNTQISEIVQQPFISAVTLSSLAARIISEGGCSKVKMNDMSLNVFPAFVTHLKNLTELELMRNLIKDLSCQQLKHGGFDGLTSLDISHNLLTGLSPLIGRLQHLSRLNLSYNQLTFLPKALCDCHSLKILSVNGNKLDSLPTSLYHCKKLIRLDLRNNPLSALVKELQLRSGPNSIHHVSELGKLMKYLEAMDKGGEMKVSRVKLMFVGEGNVGKTSLRYLLKHGKSKDKEFSVATDGVDIEDFDYGPIKYDCWDFAGQDLYYTTHQFFLTPKAIYLVMFNMAAPNYSKVEYWLKSIRLKARNSPIVLVGTHSDECTEEQIQNILKDCKNRFKKYNIHPSIHSISTVHVHSSSFPNLSDKVSQYYPSSIKDLLEDLNEVATKRRMVDRLMPTSYYYMIQVLKDRATTTPFVGVDDIKDSMEKMGISSDHYLNCIEILHDMGYVLYYGDDEKLKDLIILDPQFLTELMSTVVSYKNQWVKLGHIKEEDLSQLIKKYCLPWGKKLEEEIVQTGEDENLKKISLHEQLIHLLERFEIIYHLSNKQYIIPCMLDSQPPSDFIKHRNSRSIHIHEFQREYLFSFVPIGFFARLITRVLSMSSMVISNLWEHGFFLEWEDGQTASLEYDPVEYILDVRTRKNVDYSPKKYILTDILEAIDSLIHVFYAGDAHRLEINIPYSIYEKKREVPIQIKLKYDDVVNQALKNRYIEYEDHKIDLLLLAPDIGLVHTMALQNVKVTKQLGEGGFGIVYKGLLDDKIEVAIKELKMSTFDGILDKFKEFMHEVNLMSQFDSPYLVHLYGTSLSPLGMVMEFCPFQSLDTHLSNESIPIPWKLRCKIAYDITKALSILHSHQPAVMHRDLRSPNVFIVSTQLDAPINAKIGDFGLAQYTLPYLNELLACWQWLAPEVFDPKSPSYNEFSDIYSLGMVFWELATRHVPFSEFQKYILVTTESLTEEMLSSNEVIEQLKSSGYEIVGSTAVKEQYNVQLIKDAILNEDLRPTLPSEGVPKFFLNIITSCWKKDPQKRPILSRLLEIFSSKLTEVDWSHFDNPTPKKLDKSSEQEDHSELTTDLMSPNKKPGFLREYPVRITILSLSIQDLKINGKQVVVRLRFRGKTFETPKRKVTNQKNQLISVEWDKEALSKWSFNAMNTSVLTLEVLDGVFKLKLNSKVGVFLACVRNRILISEEEMIWEINTLALTDNKGKQNGTLNMTFSAVSIKDKLASN